MTPNGARPPASHAILHLQLWLARQPLRLSPLWVVLASVLLLDAWQSTPAFLARLLAAVIVADGLWGAFWQQVHVWTELATSPPATSSPPLPYARTDAPLSRLLHWLRYDAGAVVGRDAWLSLLLALLISAWLSPLAVLASALAALLALGSTTILPTWPALSRFLAALHSVALPWWLGLNLFAADDAWRWPSATPVWLLILGFSLLLWAGEQGESEGHPLWQWGSVVVFDIICWIYGGWPFALAAALVLAPGLLLARKGRNAWFELGQWVLLWLAVGT